ncbi:MAG: hypothetical protein FWF41_06965 [Betaproteobacteria bacterium]|nr:hypothetical protein [Betaproteobacteria bacterium]
MSKRENVRGFMLVEVLVSILLFALGIASLVSLQARALGVTDDAQHRAEAMNYANAYVGEIWAAAGVPSSGVVTGEALAGQFSGARGVGGLGYMAFSHQVTTGIPGASPPEVTFLPSTFTWVNRATTPPQPLNIPGAMVTITIRWQDRQDEHAIHSYTQTSSVSYNSKASAINIFP